VPYVGSQTVYYSYNGHGDVTALTDGNGTLLSTYYYDAFGNIIEKTGTTNNSITYAGYQFDFETGLYYLNARYYDPVVARFVSADTYTGESDDPLSLNLYTYCKNEPMMYNDPTGHETRSMDPRMVAAYAMQAGDYATAYRAAMAGGIYQVAYTAAIVGYEEGKISYAVLGNLTTNAVNAAVAKKPTIEALGQAIANSRDKYDYYSECFYTGVLKSTLHITEPTSAKPDETSVWVIIAGVCIALSTQNLKEWQDQLLKTVLETKSSPTYGIFKANAKGDFEKLYGNSNYSDDYITGLMARTYFNMGYFTTAKPGTLTNVETRLWYRYQETTIPMLINKNLPLKDQAKQAFELRNQFRTQARELMADRTTANILDQTNPNMTWEQAVDTYARAGYQGDALFQKIIDSSQKSRPSVNKNLGIK
jgi:RHS repeat-associated protein